jgi:hypothetical protein
VTGAISSQAIDIEGKIRDVEKRYNNYLKRKGLQPAGLEIKTKQRAAIDTFLRSCVAAKKCENCGGYSPSYRKDGYSKIFQKPLSKKTQKAMQALRMKLKTALEATQGDIDRRGRRDDDSDSDVPMEESEDEEEEGNGQAAAGTDKYMVQSEVEAQIKVPWFRWRNCCSRLFMVPCSCVVIMG